MILSAVTPAVNHDALADALTAASSPAVEARPAPEPTGPTAADDAWWAEQTRDEAEMADADWDAAADNAGAADSLALGYCHA